MSSNYKNEIDFDMLADLSKLQFEEVEKDEIKEELEAFLSLVNKIKDIDFLETEEDNCQKYNVFREDELSGICYTTDEMLSNAKTCNDGYITVPRVVEGSDND